MRTVRASEPPPESPLPAEGRSVLVALPSGLFVELRGVRDAVGLVEREVVVEDVLLEDGSDDVEDDEEVLLELDEDELLELDEDELVAVVGVLVGVSDGLGAAERVCCACGSDSPHPVSTNAAAQSAAGSAT
ncbi:hypothetical protein BH39T_PBIAJDOK_01159 [Barrientosiimonas humi]|nr:hypothetical protein BH39T_PBIAJDOK_01159 [Barrientosiimonas humi]